MDQTTASFENLLVSNNVYFPTVIADMTKLYKLLNFTVNDYAKAFIKRRSTKWFASNFLEAFKSSQAPEYIDISLDLSTLNRYKSIGS